MQLAAPTLWLAECVSAIRGSVHARVISLEEGRLALAERLGAELWTADGRLVWEAQQAGVTWVRWVREEGAG